MSPQGDKCGDVCSLRILMSNRSGRTLPNLRGIRWTNGKSLRFSRNSCDLRESDGILGSGLTIPFL